MVEEKNIAVCIILTLVTCGIYGLYWIYSMATDLNTISGTEDTSGGMVVLFSIVTCGIYMFYWMYKAGEKINAAKAARNTSVNENQGLILMLFAVFGLALVSYALLQSELNTFANTKNINGN